MPDVKTPSDGAGAATQPEAVFTGVAPVPDLDSVGPRPALVASLARLDEAIRVAIEQFERSQPSPTPDAHAGEYITHDETERLLDGEHGWVISDGHPGTPRFALTHAGSRLAALQQMFGLTATELDALLVAASVDLDPAYERLYAYLQDDVHRRRPTVQTVARLAGTATHREWEALALFAADAPLIRCRLLRLAADAGPCPPALCAHYVIAHEAVVRYLADVDERDQTLATFCDLYVPATDGDLLQRWRRHPELAAFTTAILDVEGALTVAFVGPQASERTRLAQALAAVHDLQLLIVDARGLMTGEPADHLDRALLSARLRGAVMYLDGLDQLLPSEQSVLRALLVQSLPRAGAHVILSSAVAWPLDERTPEGLVTVPVRFPDADERAACWSASLDQLGVPAAPFDIEAVARTFELSETQIRTAVQLVARRRDSGAVLPRLALFAAARGQMSFKLPRAVGRVEASARWDDLILPDDVLSQLKEICTHESYRHTVFGHWGFGSRSSRGKGLTVLFSGPPGTGKTTACEVIAAELGRTLLKIDLSQVVSKYIGDTEKQLDEVFAVAEQAAAVLLFDEADTLFGKRTQISDAHDRYANVEVGYLLQKIEEYTGIAVLATNLHSNIDPAFARRMHFAVEFPFPDERSRADIWKVTIPDTAPVTDDLAFDLLARRFPVAGGSIRNMAVAAAILAAAEGQPISVAHVAHAARREYQKLGKMPPDASFFGQGQAS